MIIGTTLIQSGTATDPYYSPSFAKGGQAALFTIDVTHIKGSPDREVTIEHKNVDETTWGTANSFSTISATGLNTLNVTDLKEEVRYKFHFGAGGSAGDFVHVLVPAPAWRPY